MMLRNCRDPMARSYRWRASRISRAT